MNTLSGRSGSIDLTKCMATCAVLMIHCSANRYQLFTVGSLDWLTVLFWNGTCKWAVPVFLMCSGALMNDPQRELPLNRLFPDTFSAWWPPCPFGPPCTSACGS